MKERITITIDKKLLQWLDANVEDKLFANRSHGFEYLIAKEMKQKEQNKDENKQ